jgi:hypothetical protein
MGADEAVLLSALADSLLGGFGAVNCKLPVATLPFLVFVSSYFREEKVQRQVVTN